MTEITNKSAWNRLLDQALIVCGAMMASKDLA